MSLFGPYFRTPLTDLTATPINHQHFGKCANFEMKAMECMEAYGLERGKKKCEDLFEDLNECQSMTKQWKRCRAMQIERERQVKAGILKGDEIYSKPPKVHGY